MISSSQRPLPDNTRHSQQTNIHAPGGIRTYDLSRSAAHHAPPGAWILVCCECRVLSVRGLCDDLITRPEESYRLWCVVVCDLETSRMGAPYIYNISSLRFNDLTLILLTWVKWLAPNNASRQQTGFNSGFKGLNVRRYHRTATSSALPHLSCVRESFYLSFPTLYYKSYHFVRRFDTSRIFLCLNGVQIFVVKWVKNK